MVRRVLRSRGNDRVLHQLQALLSLPAMARVSSGASGRRQRQRLAIAQRLLDPLPPGLAARAEGERFWRLLRWGGAGMLLAWLLQR